MLSNKQHHFKTPLLMVDFETEAQGGDHGLLIEIKSKCILTRMHSYTSSNDSYLLSHRVVFPQV